MKSIQISFIAIVLVVLALPTLVSAQDITDYDLTYKVHRTYPAVFVTKDKLNSAQTLTDLNKNYEASWVKEYKAVEISVIMDGSAKSATSQNDQLTLEQKEIMKSADTNSEISVHVSYLPDNTLPQNDVKEIFFSFTVDPDVSAGFTGGEDELKLFLEEHIIGKISTDKINQYQLAAFKFTVDEDGGVVNPQMLWSTDDENSDKLILESFCNMPKWTPATYSDGLRVKQDFVLTIGDMQSCVVNLLGIRNLN